MDNMNQAIDRPGISQTQPLATKIDYELGQLHERAVTLLGTIESIDRRLLPNRVKDYPIQGHSPQQSVVQERLPLLLEITGRLQEITLTVALAYEVALRIQQEIEA